MRCGWRPLARRIASLHDLGVGVWGDLVSIELDGIVGEESRRLSSGQEGRGRGANAIASGPNGPSWVNAAGGFRATGTGRGQDVNAIGNGPNGPSDAQNAGGFSDGPHLGAGAVAGLNRG